MHTDNHPKLLVMADLGRALLTREGIPFLPDVEQSMDDELEDEPVWHVYPEIAKRLGCEGAYQFVRGGHKRLADPTSGIFDLPQFVEASFKRYATHGKEDFFHSRLSSPRYQGLGKFVRTRPRRSAEARPSSAVTRPRGSDDTARNPYQDLPDHQFWRRALERIPMAEVDPVVHPRFRLQRGDKVATAGSCFAQHIARTLVKHGFNYYIAERAEHLPAEEAQRRN